MKKVRTIIRESKEPYYSNNIKRELIESLQRNFDDFDMKCDCCNRHAMILLRYWQEFNKLAPTKKGTK